MTAAGGFESSTTTVAYDRIDTITLQTWSDNTGCTHNT
jgi:hypothetical protein